MLVKSTLLPTKSLNTRNWNIIQNNVTLVEEGSLMCTKQSYVKTRRLHLRKQTLEDLVLQTRISTKETLQTFFVLLYM